MCGAYVCVRVYLFENVGSLSSLSLGFVASESLCLFISLSLPFVTLKGTD